MIAGRRILVLALALFLLGACASTDTRPPEVGSVTLIADGVEHEAYGHLIHGYWDGMNTSGIDFDWWLDLYFDAMTEIQYTGDLQIVVDGRDGCFSRVRVQQWDAETRDAVQSISIDFSDGKADAVLPDAPGIYLLSVFVTWTLDGNRVHGNEFMDMNYFFKVVR